MCCRGNLADSSCPQRRSELILGIYVRSGKHGHLSGGGASINIPSEWPPLPVCQPCRTRRSTAPPNLPTFVGGWRSADRIGIDTEFVSEDTFRPELCLVQVVTPDELAVIDPYRVGDMLTFWEMLANGEHSTIVHAAREEVNFALTACGRPPANLFDTQLAAGFCSAEYPSSYGSVVTKFLNARPAKGEQRTDWRRRPLTEEQIDYALEDVRYLLPLYETLGRKLKQLNRLEWLGEEMDRWLADLHDAARQPALAASFGSGQSFAAQSGDRPRVVDVAPQRSRAARCAAAASAARRSARRNREAQERQRREESARFAACTAA